jgi:hypothetical protein
MSWKFIPPNNWYKSGSGSAVDPAIAIYNNTVYAAMPTKPTGTVLLRQQTLFKTLYDKGIFAKSRLIYVPAVHAEDSSLINWKNPGTYDLTKVNTPTWTIEKGFKGVVASSSYLNTHFNPTVNGTLTEDDIAFALGVGTDVQDANTEIGGSDGVALIYFAARSVADVRWQGINSIFYSPSANTRAIGHYVVSRNAHANYTVYKNKTETTPASPGGVSTGLLNAEIYLCGFNNNGEALTPNIKDVPYFILSSYLSATEKDYIVDAFETYLLTSLI